MAYLAEHVPHDGVVFDAKRLDGTAKEITLPDGAIVPGGSWGRGRWDRKGQGEQASPCIVPDGCMVPHGCLSAAPCFTRPGPCQYPRASVQRKRLGGRTPSWRTLAPAARAYIKLLRHIVLS